MAFENTTQIVNIVNKPKTFWKYFQFFSFFRYSKKLSDDTLLFINSVLTHPRMSSPKLNC